MEEIHAIQLEDGFWYWYNEAYLQYGPYSSELEAKEALIRYCETELQ